MRVLITGCGLFDQNAERWVWGDLWEVWDTYVFNAVLHEGQTSWSYGVPEALKTRNFLLINHEANNYFERRGVIVVPKLDARLNFTAMKYLQGDPS